MRNVLIAVGVVAVVVGGYAAWSVWSGDIGDADLDTVSRDEEGIELDAPGVRRQSPRETPGVDETERPSEETGEAETAGPDGPLVTVVDMLTGEPVAGATVWWISDVALDARVGRLFIREGGDFRELFSHYGKSFETDDDGKVRVPRARQPLLAATEGDRWALDTSGRRRTEYTLEIQQLLVATVRVVDEGGKPVAGISTALRKTNARVDEVTVETNESGIAVYPLTPLLRGEPVGGLCVALAIPLSTPVEESLADRDLSETIELVAPALGKLSVSVVDAEDRPYPDKVVMVGLQPSGGGATAAGIKAARTPIGGWRYQKDGQVTFDVGLGMELDVVAQNLDPGFTPVTESVSSPTTPGETVTLKISLSPTLPVLTGRLLDADGRPLANAQTQAQAREHLTGNARTTASGRFKTDERGRFGFELSARAPRDGWQRKLEIDVTVQRSEHLVAEIDISREFPAGETDLGDITVGAEPVLVQGEVRDAKGDPIGHAWVRVEKKEYQGQGRHWWLPVGSRNTRTATDGSFVLRGRVDTNELRVTATKRSYTVAREEVARGATGVRLVLGQSTGIRGRIVVAEGVSPRQLALTAQREDGEGSRGSQVKEDGSFEILELEPGTYTVTVRVMGGAEPLAVVRGVSAEAGAPPDPRLNPLDLASEVRTIKITVTDDAGSPVTNAAVSVHKPGDRRKVRASGRGGVYTAIVSGDAVDVTVAAPNHRTEHRQGVRADVTIKLAPPIRVRLILDGMPTLPDGFALEVSLMGGSRARRMGRGGRSPTNGIVEETVGEPGTYHVSIMVTRRRGNATTSRGIGRRQSIEVLDVGGPQDFNITLDAAAVQKTIETLGGS